MNMQNFKLTVLTNTDLKLLVSEQIRLFTICKAINAVETTVRYCSYRLKRTKSPLYRIVLSKADQICIMKLYSVS